MLQRDLDMLAYTALNYVGHRPQELKAVERRRLAQRSRVTWMKDPQAGASVDLMNDFVFGRGMKAPKANDPLVQQVLDDFWNDPDNQLVLTNYQSQLALGTDLELQSNLFFLIFEDGQDGKVKLGLLDHDTVETVVRDPDNRLRVLYYLARHFDYRWNFETDQPQIIVGVQSDTAKAKVAPAPTIQTTPGYAMNPVLTGQGQVRYFQHWRNVEDAENDMESGARKDDPELFCPEDKLGAGKVYHVGINRGMEMAFGHPRMDRLIRWYNSFNCHDEQTETLTSEGWLALDELDRRWQDGTVPLIAGYDKSADRIVMEQPENFNVQSFDSDEHGPMLRFKGATGLDMLVTPHHRMLVKTKYRRDAPWEFIHAENVWGGRGHIAPVAAPLGSGVRVDEFVLPAAVITKGARAAHGRLKAEGIYAADDQLTQTREFRVPMDAWLRWLGWWISEGSSSGAVHQSVASPRWEAIKAACEALEIPGRTAISASKSRTTPLWSWRPTAAHKQMKFWLAEHAGLGAENKKIPEFVFSLAAEQQMELLRGLMGGDGCPEHFEDKGRGWYATKSPQLADDVQRLATMCGWRATLREVVIYGHIHYRVHLAARNTRRLPQGTPTPYKGRVYCFQMPSGTMITRRNGAVAISGNTFMDARVDMMSATAAFVMKRKVKGTPQQLQRMANQALSRRSVLGMSTEPQMMADIGPKAGGVINENDSVDHEPFNLNSNAMNAQADAQMLRSQISAATRWPASYYGDASQANLATATSLELPVLKAVESRQEIFEQVVRFCCDRAIERAVDCGILDPLVSGDEQDENLPDKQPAPANLEPGDVTVVSQGYEDQEGDEQATQRDLGYEFSMPNPLKRLIGDLVTAAQLTAQSFDPNNTNTELSRILLGVVLAEAFEIEDPAGAVERIFPQGYVDPATAQQLPGAPGGGGPMNTMGEFSPDGGSGFGQQPDGFGQDPNNQYSQGYGGGNPYGAVSSSQSPEDAMQEAQMAHEAASIQERWRKRSEVIDKLLDDQVLDLITSGTNGNGSE